MILKLIFNNQMNKKRKILIVFDDMVVDIFINGKLNPIVI